MIDNVQCQEHKPNNRDISGLAPSGERRIARLNHNAPPNAYMERLLMKKVLRRSRRGGVLFNTMILVLLLLFTGVAFMRWAVDESFQAQVELAETQAYYVAQYGIFKEVLAYLRTRPPTAIDENMTFQQGSFRSTIDQQVVGQYSHLDLVKAGRSGDDEGEGGGGNVYYERSYVFDLLGTGTVPLSGGNPNIGRNSNWADQVSRTVRVRARMRTYADYMYLTKYELTMFNEIIWFWGPDVLNGRTHSNDYIGMKGVNGQPSFYGPISTSQEAFIYISGADPYFAYPPVFNAPPVYFPETADNLRSCAAGQGNFITNDNGNLQTRLVADGGAFLFEQWPNGTPYDCTAVMNAGAISFGPSVAIFVEGDCQVWGENITGRVTVGTEGYMWLMDNVCISGVSINLPSDEIPRTNPNIVGLISESNIVIKDTYANGRGSGATAPGGVERKHITITAAMVALGESFTFEHQNDTWNTYYWCDPNGAHPGQTDERGSIRMMGSVTQYRRGYVHRSTCGGTGYAKDYVYDFRLGSNPPPCFLEATDDRGNSLFDIVWIENQPLEYTPDVD